MKMVSQGQWSTGLFDCCDDMGSCCLTFFCPCVTYGRIANIVNRGSRSCFVSGAIYLLLHPFKYSFLLSCFNRSKLRSQYSLEESPCNDFCVTCFCEGCALCQEYRELRNRGFDMKIGWQGNVERQTRGVTAPPATQTGMSR